jgi:hypothetical protein
VDVRGVVKCVTTSAVPEEGARCEAPEDCGLGYGCVRLLGLARCLRFCNPAVTDVEPCAQPAGQLTGLHIHSKRAQCSALFEGSPDIGVCVLPCHPSGPEGQDCPPETTCAGLHAVGLATCAPMGPQGEGEPCGAVGGCSTGLLCAPEPDGVRRCRPAAGVNGACDVGEPEALQGLFDRVGWDPEGAEAPGELAICR